MVGMGEEFLSHANQWRVEPELVERLIGESLDIENLIEALDRVCSARTTLEIMGQPSVPLERADKVRAEVEWFVQHVAERVVASDARLLWGPLLSTTPVVQLTLATTNYDRAIELAANAESIVLDDGFGPLGYDEAATWAGFDQAAQTPRLVKLHGSTDWYAAGPRGTPTKLRHPMPLFGRAVLRLATGSELGSALVLPSREKLLTHSPYPRLSQTFLNAADSCEMAIFVGSSLRDHHIRGAAEATARRAPVFVVNPAGNTYGLEQVTPIKQSASTFLMSTLPNALKGSDPAGALRRGAGDSTNAKGVFAPVKQALDTEASVETRCRALEQLDEMSVPLDGTFLRQVMSDQHATVARYALGLVSLSPEREDLVQHAATTTHASDPAFLEDLALLREMLQSA